MEIDPNRLQIDRMEQAHFFRKNIEGAGFHLSEKLQNGCFREVC